MRREGAGVDVGQLAVGLELPQEGGGGGGTGDPGRERYRGLDTPHPHDAAAVVAAHHAQARVVGAAVEPVVVVVALAALPAGPTAARLTVDVGGAVPGESQPAGLCLLVLAVRQVELGQPGGDWAGRGLVPPPSREANLGDGHADDGQYDDRSHRNKNGNGNIHPVD